LFPLSTWTQIEAERAFKRAARARHRAALVGRVKRRGLCGLAVYDETRRSSTGVRLVCTRSRSRRSAAPRSRTGPRSFDHQVRPTAGTRPRWQSIWLAFQRGAPLPPIEVVQVGDDYAIREGHHRVSVAKALGALTIRAIIA
jgi:hypothetical protein